MYSIHIEDLYKMEPPTSFTEIIAAACSILSCYQTFTPGEELIQVSQGFDNHCSKPSSFCLLTRSTYSSTVCPVTSYRISVSQTHPVSQSEDRISFLGVIIHDMTLIHCINTYTGCHSLRNILCKNQHLSNLTLIRKDVP